MRTLLIVAVAFFGATAGGSFANGSDLAPLSRTVIGWKSNPVLLARAEQSKTLVRESSRSPLPDLIHSHEQIPLCTAHPFSSSLGAENFDAVSLAQQDGLPARGPPVRS